MIRPTRSARAGRMRAVAPFLRMSARGSTPRVVVAQQGWWQGCAEIIFSGESKVDELAWELISSSEFQRLRRIKQLGFSELVFQGATHSRLAHSVGVFNTARDLLRTIERLSSDALDEERRMVCLLAALLHDVGHGPFSHAFESAMKGLGIKKKHEKWTADIILGDTEINSILCDFDPDFPEKITSVITDDDPKDLYAAIVSSQFDADRMDYLRRDRYMCGVATGGFDYRWILENLEIAEIIRYTDGEQEIGNDKIPWFVLNPKARGAAESYLLARYQLYSTIYYHKATRSAEKMLEVFLRLLAEAMRNGDGERVGLPAHHPINNFLSEDGATVSNYLIIDDTSVWSALNFVANGECEKLAELACRILGRKLYKAFDLSSRVDPNRDTGETFVYELREKSSDLGLVYGETLIDDRPRQTGYDWYEWDTPSSLKKVLVRDIERNENIDIAGASEIVRALNDRKFLRVYVPDSESREKVEGLWRERRQ